MSRSYKKHMGGSYCGGSDKYSRSDLETLNAFALSNQ